MVQVVLIIAGLALLAFAFGIFGNIPPTPTWLEGVSDTLVDIIIWPVQILAGLLGGHLFFGTIILLGVVMAWEPVYHLVMWVLKKIPVVNIK